MNTVTHRERGVIPGCRQPTPDSEVLHGITVPNQQPMVELRDGSFVSVSVRSFILNIKDDVEDSREQRGALIHQNKDPWYLWF